MKPLLLLALLALAARAEPAVEFTGTELRWLRAGWPVIEFAKAQQLPVDIVVQRQSDAGEAPLAMGYDGGRCLLVLAMRGNPAAESTLDRIEPALLPAAVEVMFAHELGHCWRHLQGHWHALPAGFHEAAGDPVDADLRAMRNARREEGFADLAGLAWTASRRPGQYQQVHAWIEAERADQPVAGAHHDTRAWIRLARDPRAFGASGPSRTLFEQADALWCEGLREGPGDGD